MPYPRLVSLAKHSMLKIASYLPLLFPPIILAGPPFITDDPNPVAYQHKNLYLFAESVKTAEDLSVAMPALQFDYGLTRNCEVTTTIPFFLHPANEKTHQNTRGLGDIQLGLKYAFISETNGRPQIAFAPIYFAPSGDTHRALGAGGSQIQLPFWGQKSWGDWTSYAGGGYMITNAAMINSGFFGGGVLQWHASKNLMVGGELFAQEAPTKNIASYLLSTLGGSYTITPTISTLFSISHSLVGAKLFVGYLGIAITA